MENLRDLLDLTSEKLTTDHRTAVWKLQCNQNIVSKPRKGCIYGYNNYEIVDVNHQNKYGWTILMLTSQCLNRSFQKTVKTLLAVDGIDVNIQNKWGMTALIFASLCNKSSEETVKMLLAFAGIDVNIKDKWGITALIYASRYGSKENVRMLKEAVENS